MVMWLPPWTVPWAFYRDCYLPTGGSLISGLDALWVTQSTRHYWEKNPIIKSHARLKNVHLQ